MIIKKNSLIDELKFRKLITQITFCNLLNKQIKKKKINFYIGFDPTTDSLHVGHLLILITLLRFKRYGHNPYIILGGATSLIGDPSFKLKNNKIFDIKNIIKWTNQIRNQLFCFFKKNNIINMSILNNFSWFKTINLLNFFIKIGNLFSINQMLSRETIKNRIFHLNQGINYKEFSYIILQSYDFLYLYKKYKIKLQIGGHDQWTNILYGINLINKIFHKKAYGITLPLLINDQGIKFSKSINKNNIWLDPNKTSPYKFYQFWMNVTDEKVIDYIKMFTFLSMNIIEELLLYKNNTGYLQRILAASVTKLVHGDKGLKSAQRISNFFFKKNKLRLLNKNDFKQLKLDGVPFMSLQNKNIKFLDILLKSNLIKSKKEGRYLLKSQSIKLNNEKIISDPFYIVNNIDKIYKKYSIISRGKKNFVLICWE